jgi:hypothetical protein
MGCVELFNSKKRKKNSIVLQDEYRAPVVRRGSNEP